MTTIRLVKASEIEVEPALIHGLEQSGLVYFTWASSPVVGAQCGFCQTILWVKQREDAILNEPRPSEVPDSGPGYKLYAEDNILRFMISLPPCPSCGRHEYDRFVNNVNYPRFPNGEEVPQGLSGADVVKEDPERSMIFLLN